MPSSAIAVQKLLRMMFNSATAESVFDQSAPFFDAYKLGYLDALAKEDTKVLDVHREAIFYLKPFWESSVILALVVISSKNPDANYVESLAFYFSLKGKKERFVDDMKEHKPEVSGLLVASLMELENHLKRSMDQDLADVFLSVRCLVSKECP